MITLDTETCGLHGPIVLLQYAEDDGPIHLHSPWAESVRSTMSLIEMICSDPDGVVGFNLSFDWFHLCQMYTVLALLPDPDAELGDWVEQYAEFEPLGRDGPCLKPTSAFDIMLHARKGPYQSTMDRGDIRIRRVPTPLAWQLAAELEQRIKLKDIYFARRKDKRATKWQVFDIEDEDGEVDENFKDIVLKFAPSSALKALAVDALGLKQDSVLLFADVDLDPKFYPVELGYAPFAKAVGNRLNWKGAWPDVLRHHVNHWGYNTLARRYAEKDVEHTRNLYKHFGSPPLGDNDSLLACMVGAVRWRGFKVDVDGIRRLREQTINSQTKVWCKVCNVLKTEHHEKDHAFVQGEVFKVPTAPATARYYVTEHMDETERLIIKGSTKKVLLQEIAEWKSECPTCKGGGLADTTKCVNCLDSGLVEHKSASRAREVLNARQSNYEVNLYDKFLVAGRFHASFVVIGALSSRMAGTDDLNAQGIKKTKEVRSQFPLSFSSDVLCGGDFAGFEVTIAEAVYNDPNLRKNLLTCELCGGGMERVGESVPVFLFLDADAQVKYLEWRLRAEAKKAKDKPSYVPRTEAQVLSECFENDFICRACGSNKGKKIHALFGVNVFPEYDYDGIKATEGTKDDKYTKSKSAVFAMLYGGTEHTLAERLGVPVEVGIEALKRFHREFPGVKRFQLDITNAFCSMRQPGGIGTKVEWHKPADFRETMFGFRRYFTLENQICSELFKLANEPPKDWHKNFANVRVSRRPGRLQTPGGAVQSALYASAFGLQASNMRAAANHDIQSAGATITKMVQCAIWEVQPVGIGEWVVQPMNIHDEIMCPTKPGREEEVKAVVNRVVESIRPKIPLIKMDWVIGLKTWAEKG